MRPALSLRRRAPLRVAVSGIAAAGGVDGNGKVWRATLPHLARRVRLEVVPEGCSPRRRPDVWLADHRPLTAAAGAPLVRVVHEASWVREDFRAVLSDEELAWADDAICHAAGDATRLLLPTPAGRDEVRSRTGIPAAACDVIAYGHDPRLAARADAARGRALVDEAGADGRPFVLFCGQAHPKKQLAVLREAMCGLGTLDVALVVVAGPSHRFDAVAALREAVAPLERSGFVPPSATKPEPCPVVVDLTTRPGDAEHRLDDRALADVMAAAAVLCLPSLGEGFGLPVLEAMAVGCPVVVSDRGALPWLVGDAGRVVAPAAEPVAAALAQALLDGRAAGRAGRTRAAALTWAATAAGWHGALERAAAAPADALRARTAAPALEPAR